MTVVVNKTEGTVTFPLGHVECVLKVTWRAVADIENDLGYGMVALSRRVVTSNFGLKDLSIVILHGLKASGTEGNPTLDKVSEMVMKSGLLNSNTIKAVSEFCDFALTGGEEPKKEEAAE